MSDDTPHNPKRDDTPSPRAFATTTGFVCQIAGLAYFLTGAAYWFVSGRVQDPTPVRVDTVADFFNDANVTLTVTTINVLAAVAGGLAMVAFGIGLQGERRRSGVGAMIATGALSAIGTTSVIVYVAFAGAWIRAMFALLYTAANVVLFLLAGHSAAILKRHPPPENLNVVDDAWLEEHERTRRRH